MSSYNSIEKIKYTDNLSDAVSLNEYIVFGDERAEEKFIVFKFSNNVNQKLLGMKFEVSQYDMHDNLIEKSVVIYNNFLAKANSEFVPKAKLRVLYACKRISVKLVQAAFDRVLWNEGEYVDNTYKFEHYARDEKYIEETERPKETPPQTAYKKPTKDDTERFRLKNITKKNIAVFPKVFYWITSILLVIAIGVTIYLFPKFSDKFTVDNYDLQIVSGNTVRLIGYEGEEETLSVPETVGDYQIVRIGKGAFRHLPMQTVQLPESIVAIESGAFRNMPSLKSVQCAAPSVEVSANAFDGIVSLTSFEMPGAKLMKNCFHGCSRLAQIRFAETNVSKFLDLFGATEHGVTVRTFAGVYSQPDIFFEGVRFIG